MKKTNRFSFILLNFLHVKCNCGIVHGPKSPFCMMLLKKFILFEMPIRRLQRPIVITRCPSSAVLRQFTFSTSYPEPDDRFLWNVMKPGLAPRMNVLFWGTGDFPVSYSKRDTSWNAWNRYSGSFMVDTGILFSNMKFPSHECYMTFWPLTNSDYPTNRLSTNFMTLIPTLTFTELRVVSMEHLQRVWHASGERLPYRTPGSVPHFGTCLCSNGWDQIPRICHVFTRLFNSNTPWYFLDFVWYRWRTQRPLQVFVFSARFG